MRLRSLSLVLLVLCSVAAPTVATGAASEEPAVDVTVRSTAIADGDTYESGSDVGIRINASVGDAATDGTELSEVVVRVNGNLADSISLNGTTASVTVRPELDDGENSVRVIVTDDAGSVNATAFTVVKDAEAPHVYLTEPYQSAPWKPIADGTTNGSRTTIAGNVIEESGIEKLQITREYDGDRSTRVLRDVGENFSVDMLLGYTDNETTTNEFRITVTDTFDNVRLYAFEIDVTDERAPTISLEPFPNETAENRVDLAGTIEDDVGIQSANLTLYGPDDNVTGQSTIAAPRTRNLDPDRLSKSFEEPLYTLYPGTYEAEIVATDITGKTTTRTVTIERVPQSERDVAPEIAVDRDRTVVTGPDSLFLSGAVFEGVTERLVVETRLVATGETLDYQVLHSGSRRERIAFDRDVAIAPNRTEVIVRATDAKGVEHTERFVVDGSSRETFVGASDDGDVRWPKVTVEQLQDGRIGTASSAVTVRRGLADTTVSIPDSGDGPVVATENVSVDRLDLALATDTNVTATVVARERAGTAPSAPAGSTPAASVTIQHSVSEDAVDGLEFTINVRRAYLDAHGIDPGSLSVYRLSDGEWAAVETSVESTNDTVRYAVDSPGLSVFSLATEPTATGSESTANGTAPNGTAGNGTVANGTANETMGNETMGNETAGDGGSGESAGGDPQIIVSNVTVNRTAVAVNESVRVNVTLANKGDAEGTYTAGLQTIHGMNVSTAGKESVAVPAGEERMVDFTTAFATEGNHTVMVNGTQAGPVVVGGGGGGLFSFLSFLSFLPLRLIGMALGGILGLLLLLVLLRFVLGKVGGDGESASG